MKFFGPFLREACCEVLENTSAFHAQYHAGKREVCRDASLSLGKFAIVGAPLHDSKGATDNGAAYLYTRTDTGVRLRLLEHW